MRGLRGGRWLQAREASPVSAASASRSAVRRQLKKRAKSLDFGKVAGARRGRRSAADTSEAASSHPLTAALPGVEVLFENDHVCVISKPPG